VAKARRTTLERHTVDGQLTEERSRLHAQIIREVVEGAAARDVREAVLYAGGPASGKSTLLGRLGPTKADGFVGIDPDLIRQRLPEYDEMIQDGDPEAARLTHDEASAIAKAATDVAIRLGRSLVIDAVGKDDRGQFSSKVHRLLDLGYGVTVRFATVPVAIAQRRESRRAATTGRSVPLDVLLDGHREVSKAFLRVTRIDGVRVEVYDTSEDVPVLVAEGIGSSAPESGGLEVHRADSYHRFVEKAKE
jgi:predicted ABC-type ATPase